MEPPTEVGGRLNFSPIANMLTYCFNGAADRSRRKEVGKALRLIERGWALQWSRRPKSAEGAKNASTCERLSVVLQWSRRPKSAEGYCGR